MAEAPGARVCDHCRWDEVEVPGRILGGSFPEEEEGRRRLKVAAARVPALAIEARPGAEDRRQRVPRCRRLDMA